MEAFWRGKAHFQEVRDIDWSKPPYDAHHEGDGWFGKPIPFPNGEWYLFSRKEMSDKPSYCPGPQTWQVIVRTSSDEGQTWSNPAVVVATPGPQMSPDACGIVDGSSYYDRATNSWHMLAQCLAAHNAGGWSMCHYVRPGPSPMGPFTAHPRPAVTGGQLWSRQICDRPRSECDPHKTTDEGTPDIVEKVHGYFYVTFHGFSPPKGFRGVAKTADFHRWIVSGPYPPDAPIVAPPECQSWNPGCIGAGEASTLIAGNYQYMMVETPSVSLACTPGQRWPIALLRTSKYLWPAWSSPLWQRFHANPLLLTSWPGPRSYCGVQYPRWAVGADHVYILYEDLGYENSTGRAAFSARRLLELVPGGGPPVVFAAPGLESGGQRR